MNRAIEEAAGIVETVVPAARGAKWIAYAIIALVAAIALGVVIWWVFVRPAHLAQAAGQAKVDSALSGATAAAATKAVEIQVVHDHTIERINTITERGENAVHTAEGADASAPAVAGAQRAAVCLYGAHAAQPDCAALRGDRQGDGAAGPDAGRPAGSE